MSEGSPSKLSGIMKKAKSAVGYGKKGAEAGSSKKGGHSQQSSTSSTGSNFSPGCKSHPTEGTDARGIAQNSPGPKTSGPESSSFASPGADVTGNYASADIAKEIGSDVPGDASSPRTKTAGVAGGSPTSPPQRILTAENATPSQFAAAYGYPEIAHDDPSSDFAQRHSSSVAQDLQKYGPGNV
ncbi:hypothetical protein MMC31_000236 [Peltigera leucophlebia]|nr:hypothetical protein [Peltigera leucophlebia]